MSLSSFAAPPSYDRTFIAELIAQAQRELDATYRKDANVVVPYGKVLSFYGTGGHLVELGLNGSNQFTISIDGATAFALGTDADIIALTSAYIAADAVVSASVTSEATTRATADSAEATTRASADATLTTSVSTVSASVTTETTARVNGDNALSSSIASLTTAYQAADTTLQSNITAEASTRSSADSTETTNRTSADSTLQTNINTVSAAVTTEATTRASADSSEASTRSSADATLTTNLATANANITTNTSAIATNTSAIATQTSRIDATFTARSNLVPNSTFALGLNNWGIGSAGFSAGYVTALGYFAISYTNGALQYSDEASVTAGTTYTLSVVHGGGVFSANSSYTAVNFYNSSHAYISTLGVLYAVSGYSYSVASTTCTAPVGAVYARVIISSNGLSGGGFFLAQKIKLEPGSVASPWSDDLVDTIINASVSNIAEAYATNSGSTARILWKVNTSTNVATIEQSAHSGYSDGTWNGSVIKLAADLLQLLAKNIDFGTNTHFEDTKGTIYTVAGSYRIRILGAFGASTDCVLWYGLNSVTLNTETRTNGVFALGTDGIIYVGASPLSIAPVFDAYDNSTNSGFEFVAPPGTASTVLTIAAVNGTAPYTYSWTLLSSGGMTVGGGTTSSTLSLTKFFSISSSVYESWRCTVTDADGRVKFVDTTANLGAY